MTVEIEKIRSLFARAEDVAPLDGVAPPIAAELTEDGVAAAFARSLGAPGVERFKYDHAGKEWYFWDGSRYRRDTTGRHVEVLKEIIRRSAEGLTGRERRVALKAATVAGSERLARTDPALADAGEEWDTDPMLLGCPGGTVDLTTGKLRKADPADRITKQAAVDPHDEPCPRWTKFLMETASGDEEVIHFLQVWAGYLLTGLTREHVLLFIFGPGGNGKSVFANVLSRVLGDYAATASMDTFVAARGERHPVDLAMLRGARLVTASETEDGRAWAESRLKSITGGDNVTARFMHGNFFTYSPNFKLMLLGNHQPALRNVDEAVRRRFLILPFTRKPARVDPELEERLFEEAPQILSWAIRGCLEWVEEGLPRPEAIRVATEQYFEDQDSFGTWFDEVIEADTVSSVAAADLFASWKEFAEAIGERPGTQKAMASRLRRRGLVNGREHVDGKLSRVWRGIRLKDPM